MTSALAGGFLAATLALGGSSFVAVSPAEAATPKFSNCTAMQKTYKHGVGKKGAKDKVRSDTKPVTNFKVSNAIYTKYKGMDRDKDGIACEKR